MACFYDPRGRYSNLHKQLLNEFGKNTAESIMLKLNSSDFIYKNGNWVNIAKQINSNQLTETELEIVKELLPFKLSNNLEPVVQLISGNENKEVELDSTLESEVAQDILGMKPDDMKRLLNSTIYKTIEEGLPKTITSREDIENFNRLFDSQLTGLKENEKSLFFSQMSQTPSFVEFTIKVAEFELGEYGKFLNNTNNSNEKRRYELIDKILKDQINILNKQKAKLDAQADEITKDLKTDTVVQEHEQRVVGLSLLGFGLGTYFSGVAVGFLSMGLGFVSALGITLGPTLFRAAKAYFSNAKQEAKITSFSANYNKFNDINSLMDLKKIYQDGGNKSIIKAIDELIELTAKSQNKDLTQFQKAHNSTSANKYHAAVTELFKFIKDNSVSEFDKSLIADITSDASKLAEYLYNKVTFKVMFTGLTDLPPVIKKLYIRSGAMIPNSNKDLARLLFTNEVKDLLSAYDLVELKTDSEKLSDVLSDYDINQYLVPDLYDQQVRLASLFNKEEIELFEKNAINKDDLKYLNPNELIEMANSDLENKDSYLKLLKNVYEFLTVNNNDTLGMKSNTSVYNEELGKKLQQKLQELYPEIQLNITNDPLWESGEDVFNQMGDYIIKDKLNKKLLEEALTKTDEELIKDVYLSSSDQIMYKNVVIFPHRYLIDEPAFRIRYEIENTIDNLSSDINFKTTFLTERKRLLNVKTTYDINDVKKALKIILKNSPFNEFSDALVNDENAYPLITNMGNMYAKIKDKSFYNQKNVLTEYMAFNNPNAWGNGDGLLYVETPYGQVSFHVFDKQDEVALKKGMDPYGKQWSEIELQFISERLLTEYLIDKGYYNNIIDDLQEKFDKNPRLKRLRNIWFQTNSTNTILGQANIKAMSVLIDAVNQQQDTLPHEYAHHYIAWFRDTPIVQAAIQKWGSEEALVDSIGKQVVRQEGEAYNWWKNFVKWILNKLNTLSSLDKEELTKIITDAFLTREDLSKFETLTSGINNLSDSTGIKNNDVLGMKNNVNYSLKAANIVTANLAKIKKWEADKSISEKVFWEKLNTMIPKMQLELLKNSEGNNIEEKLISFVANYSFPVEINTATFQLQEGIDENGNKYLIKPLLDDDNNVVDNELVYNTENEFPTSNYSYLTVPGGMNYRENEILTPTITPSIKGHAGFASDNGVGWFRSDDLSSITESNFEFTKIKNSFLRGEIEKQEADLLFSKLNTKTRRILELQSDLFQKGRDKEDLTEPYIIETYNNQGRPERREESNPNNKNQNQFLQLLNKDNNWVTFFVKSIIQDTAKQTITEVQESDVEAKVRELEREGLLEIDCKGKLKAEDGITTLFEKGGKWEVVTDFKNAPTHKSGGKDISIQGKKVEVEKNELRIENDFGDVAVIPSKYRIEVKDAIKSNCHSCIDGIVESLPKMKDYAGDGTVFPFFGRYKRFKKSLPDNLKNTPEDEYAMRYYWKHSNKPKSFDEAINREHPMFTMENDGYYHAPSVEPTTLRFLKPKNHPTLQYELDWYNSDNPDAVDFRSKYDLNTSGKFYRYVPKNPGQ